MVSESVEFAFEDMNARVFEEARLKADELLPAVEVALQQAGDFLEEEEIEQIEFSRDKVVKAIEAGEVGALKAAVEQLDKATETLAANLVERATMTLFSSPED
jgi:molecular chaperone DnaK